MRLIRSDVALTAVLALDAAGSLTLSELASAVGSTASAATRGLEILLDDDIVERDDASRPVYRLQENETARLVIGLALARTPFDRAVAVGSRANASVELVAREPSGDLLVVFSARSSTRDQARAARYLEAAAKRHEAPIRFLDHDDVRRDLLVDPELRERMAGCTILFGDLDTTFPDRSLHGLTEGRRLHEPHPSVRLPSRHRLEKLSRAHRIASMQLFGSAVRTDFRPDSDVDVLVRYQDGVRPTLDSLIGLEHELEQAFGRDVDLVREEYLRPELRERVRSEAVPLL
jgi:predicted nucleotidyltransferase